MNGGISRLALCALVAGFSSASGAQLAPAPSTQCAPVTGAIVEDQFRLFTDAWATGDAEKVADLFAPGAVLLATVSNRPRTTHAEIADYFEHFLVGRPVARIDTSAIRLGCNSAARFGTWTIDLTNAATGATTSVPARYTFIHKYENGRWLIDHLHSSKMPEATPAH